MSIIRTKHNSSNPYFMLNRFAVNDQRLSYKAIGILTYLLSKPDNWTVIEDDLVNRHTDGKSSVATGLAELREFGYIKKVCIKSPQGRFLRWETYVVEHPEYMQSCEDIDHQTTENRVSGEVSDQNTRTPETGFLGRIVNTDKTMNTEDKKEESKEKTLSTGGVRETQGFEISATLKGSGKIREISNLLYDLLAKHRKIMRKPSLDRWDYLLRDFILNSDEKVDDVHALVVWYSDHMTDDYVPRAYSMASFLEKYANILEARDRIQKDTPEQATIPKVIKIHTTDTPVDLHNA